MLQSASRGGSALGGLPGLGGCLPGPGGGVVSGLMGGGGVCSQGGGGVCSGGVVSAWSRGRWMGLPVPGGVSAPRGGVCSRGGGIPACTEADPLPLLWTEWMTDRCKNMTLATTSLRPVITKAWLEVLTEQTLYCSVLDDTIWEPMLKSQLITSSKETIHINSF